MNCVFKLTAIVSAALLFLSLGVHPATAQTLKGTILGTITDPTGAVIPAAEVVLTETAQNVSRTAQTNETGLYVFANLDPGPYQVEVEMAGFNRAVRSNIIPRARTKTAGPPWKASANEPSQLGCMMEHMGCKGTQAHADCNIRLWNGVGSCLRGGYACINCTEPGFEQPGHPFASTPKVAGIPIGLPTDMPKAWFVALASLSKSATPKRVRQNAQADHIVAPPSVRKKSAK